MKRVFFLMKYTNVSYFDITVFSCALTYDTCQTSHLPCWPAVAPLPLKLSLIIEVKEHDCKFTDF